MDDYKKGYHITKKSNLYNIQKNGLQPRIGRRSNTVREYEEILCFSPRLESMPIWKGRLYKNQSFDELAILILDLDGIQYGARIDSAGDFFTTTAISPENIRLLQITEKDVPQNTVSLENLKNILQDISSNGNNSHYEISEKPITELFLEKPILDNEKKRLIIEELAEYEHKKWKNEYSRIEWHAKEDDNGNLVISDQDIEEIQKYSSLNYDQVDDFYKKDIRETIMESFFIMQDHNMIDYLGISKEELISILERTEYMRKNRWFQSMLSKCSLNNGKYVIPSEKAKLWESEMQMAYSELSNQQKEADRKEVYNILEEIEKSKSTKQIHTPLQKRELELMKLEEEEKEIIKEENILKQKESKGQNIGE